MGPVCKMLSDKKIFRPWDLCEVKVQDSVISTTSEDAAATKETAPKESSISPDSKVLKSYRKSKRREERNVSFETPPPQRFSEQGCSQLSCDGAFPVYPSTEYLAHSLGLAAADSLFLESMAHGYAMEEYARILNEEHQAKLISGRKQRPKKYRCPHCDVGFSNNGQLKGHIRIHTGERPFKCDEKNCGKTFTRNEELTRHKRIHSGLRPFPCAHCGKRFGRKDHLKKHSRTHLQPRALYAALPVMLPAAGLEQCYPAGYAPYISMYGY